MRRAPTGFFMTAVFVVVLGLIAVALFYHTQNQLLDGQEMAERRMSQVSEKVASYIRNGEPLSEFALQDIFSIDRQIGYIIVERRGDRGQSDRVGSVNPVAMGNAPYRIRRQMMNSEFATLADQLVLDGMGGAAPGFEVVRVLLKDKTKQTQFAPILIKYGYVIPDYTSLKWLLWFIQGAMFIFGTMLALGWSKGRRRVRPKIRQARLSPSEHSRKQAPAPQEVDLLDEPAPQDSDDDEDTEIIRLKKPQPLPQEEWIPMLDDQGMEVWKKHGSWFFHNDSIIGSPWRSSMVRSDIQFSDYIYRVKAKKISGSDGFIVLFSCDKQPLSWVLGGWNNAWSEVAGFEGTKTNDMIEHGRWYEVTIEVLPDSVSGYLNGDRKWFLDRKTLKGNELARELSPEVGIGVGVWSTVCKFKEPIIANKATKSKGSFQEVTNSDSVAESKNTNGSVYHQAGGNGHSNRPTKKGSRDA